MSRGFLIGTSWGIVVAGVGLVVASQVTDLQPVSLEAAPPVVAALNAPEAPIGEGAAPDVAAPDGTKSAAIAVPASGVAGDMPVLSPPALPQDVVPALETASVAESGAVAVPGQNDGPAATAAPDAPKVESAAEAPASDTATAALPDAQTAMISQDAPAAMDAGAKQAPVVPMPDIAAPATTGQGAALPQTIATDAAPAADTPPPAPEQSAAAEGTMPQPVTQTAPDEPKPATDTTVASTLRPAPGFASKAVEGVKTGRLPSIGAAPAVAPVAETATVVLVDDPDAPPIERFAAGFENPSNKPLFAILLQDTGGPDIDREALAAMPFPVSFVIDPTLPDAAVAAQIYRAKGKEVLMLATGIPAGANASDLAVSMEVTTAVLPEAVAVVDLESGGFQGNRNLATQVLALVRDQGRGVISWEKGLNAASQVARREGMRSAVIFRSLDSEGEGSPLISRYLDRAAFKAAQDGRVVVAGKTRPETVAALLEWAVEGRAATMALAPATAVMTSQ